MSVRTAAFQKSVRLPALDLFLIVSAEDDDTNTCVTVTSWKTMNPLF